MGTIRDWAEVAVLAAIWGGLMFFWTTRQRTDGGVEWPRSFAHIMCTLLAALLFGVLVRFGWNVFHPPLVFVTASLLGAALFFRFKAVSYARKIRS
jgi:hypothetical protein